MYGGACSRIEECPSAFSEKSELKFHQLVVGGVWKWASAPSSWVSGGDWKGTGWVDQSGALQQVCKQCIVNCYLHCGRAGQLDWCIIWKRRGQNFTTKYEHTIRRGQCNSCPCWEFLTYIPGKSASDFISPLKASWVVPLVSGVNHTLFRSFFY